MEVRLIGRKWKATSETVDGFKVISVELELGTWNSEELFTYMSAVLFGGFPLPGSRLYEAELDKIISDLTVCPSKIYTDHSRVKQDIVTFMNIREWFKKNYPSAWIEFDVGD